MNKSGGNGIGLYIVLHQLIGSLKHAMAFISITFFINLGPLGAILLVAVDAPTQPDYMPCGWEDHRALYYMFGDVGYSFQCGTFNVPDGGSPCTHHLHLQHDASCSMIYSFNGVFSQESAGTTL